MTVRNKHCTSCGKKLKYGGILCRDCHRKDKNKWKNIKKAEDS